MMQLFFYLQAFNTREHQRVPAHWTNLTQQLQKSPEHELNKVAVKSVLVDRNYYIRTKPLGDMLSGLRIDMYTFFQGFSRVG